MTAQTMIAVDTSVAVPLLVASHECHEQIAAWANGRTLTLCGHALMETYSVLTRLPGDARVSTADAVRLIDENFVEPLVLPDGIARQAHHRCALAGVAGGATYDGVIALTAREHDVTLATRDARARPTYEAMGATIIVVVDQDGEAAQRQV